MSDTAFKFTSGFAFIVSDIDYFGDDSIEIIPGYIFRRARSEEVVIIKSLIAGSAWSHQNIIYRYYESTAVKTKTGDGTWNIGYDPLPESKWRYWVIAFSGNGNFIHEIDKISAIIDVEFEYGLTVSFSGENQSGEINAHSYLSPHHVANYNYTFIRGNPAAVLTTEDLKTVGCLYQLFKELDRKYDFVRYAIENYSAIRKIPLGSNLIVIGYFSILETLVTHKPRSEETLDSITHQIHTKMTILVKMYDSNVVAHHEYENMQPKKLWGLLYSYRSDLAHGSSCKFDSGKYKVLISRDAVADFLKQHIKKLMVLAIKSPDFLSDLREC